MKIINLHVEGYRSLKDQCWSPGALNVVIGPNGGGKSNLLRVLEILKVAATGGLGDYVRKEGGMESLLWDGRVDRLHIRVKMTPLPPYTDPITDALTYEIILARLGKGSVYRIENEVLGNFHKVETGQSPQPFKLLERDTRHAVVYSMEEKGFTAPPETFSEEESLLSVVGGPYSPNSYVTAFQTELASWSIHQGFHTDPDATIRSPQVTRADTRTEPDGRNLISVLHTLYTQDREFKGEINAAMQAAFGDDFEELTFPPAADQRIQLRIRWRSLQREQSTADLSDGTLRFLFLMAVLADPNPPPLIAIDEPETGLHPSMLSIVAEYAREASSRTQVILTTHSPEFLDAFGDEPPTTTVVEWQQGETQLRTLAGKTLSYWLREYTLGELYRSAELEAMP